MPGLADQLILAFGFVHAQPSARDDVEAVFRFEFEVSDGRAEHHDLDLRVAVLQREIEVSGVPQPAVRNLPLDPHVAERRFQRAANRRCEFGDRINVPLRRFRRL